MRIDARAWSARLLLFLVACALALGGLETGLRLFLPQRLYRFPHGFFEEDPDLVFRMRPGFRGEIRSPEFHTKVRINSLGLRGPEIQPASPPTMRVLVAGDSFVSALNVEEDETFSAVLGRWMTSKLPGKTIEVINAGTPNYGTWHEIRLLRRLLPVTHPEVVVLCVFVVNDVENNLAPGKAVVRDGLLLERAREHFVLPEALQGWLQRNSMAYVCLWGVWNHARPLFGWKKVDPLAEFRTLISNRTPPKVEAGYRVSGELLREFGALLEEHRMPGLVVVIPGEMQVYPQRFKRWFSTEESASLDEATERPSRRWVDLSREAGLPVLDLLPLFRSRASGPYLYMSLDGHLTRDGNQLAGEAIGDSLLALLSRRNGGLR